jgi:hypothetical protein
MDAARQEKDWSWLRFGTLATTAANNTFFLMGSDYRHGCFSHFLQTR